MLEIAYHFKTHISPTPKLLDGKYIIEVPKHITFAALLWENRLVDATFTCKYKSTQWLDDNNTKLLGDWIDFDMKLQRKFFKYLDASVTIQNILNRRYTDSKGFLNPGRFIIAQLHFAL
jgi:hypothetical protein